MPGSSASFVRLQGLAANDSTRWGVCDEAPCMTPQLVLEQAEHDYLAGSFQLQAARYDEDGSPLEYQHVSGHFRTKSTHTGKDIGVLDFMNRLTAPVSGDIPWRSEERREGKELFRPCSNRCT